MKRKVTIGYLPYAIEESDIPQLIAILLRAKQLETDYNTKTVTTKDLSIEVGTLTDNEQAVVYI